MRLALALTLGLLAACTRVSGPCTTTVETTQVITCEAGGTAIRLPVPQ